jgi:hypothetical protein
MQFILFLRQIPIKLYIIINNIIPCIKYIKASKNKLFYKHFVNN